MLSIQFHSRLSLVVVKDLLVSMCGLDYRVCGIEVYSTVSTDPSFKT
jgi:hypothetical protein